jgi:hypothetical protein
VNVSPVAAVAAPAVLGLAARERLCAVFAVVTAAASVARRVAVALVVWASAMGTPISDYLRTNSHSLLTVRDNNSLLSVSFSISVSTIFSL